MGQFCVLFELIKSLGVYYICHPSEMLHSCNQLSDSEASLISFRVLVCSRVDLFSLFLDAVMCLNVTKLNELCYD